MKKLGFLLVALLIGGFGGVGIVAAQDAAGPATFVGSYTLWIAIILAFIASVWTFYYSQQMKGSVVGDILRLVAFGMFVIDLGFLAVVIAWGPAPTQKIVHDLLFILGYILILTAVGRMRKLGA